MDLYADKAPALAQKLTTTALELAILALSGWILFGSGGLLLAQIFHFAPPEGIPARRYVVFAFSVVVLARMAFTMFYLMHRRLPWAEAAFVPIAFAVYYVGFAVLVLPADAPIGPWDYFGIGLFVLGSVLNSGAELARDRFKKRPENKGRLYTEGLFGLSMHINFFGDVLWITAYAILAHTLWAFIIPLLMLCFFAFYNVPMLDRYLAGHYGDQFTAYAGRTKRLIPFLW